MAANAQEAVKLSEDEEEGRHHNQQHTTLPVPSKVNIVRLTFEQLDVEEVIQWIRSEEAAITVIAFGPHVHVKKLANAEQAGCDQVYVRSEFFSQMKTIFSRALARHVTGEEDI